MHLKIIDNQWEYPDVPFLRKYTVYLNILKNNQALIGATKDSEIIKIIFVLQNFIYYLLYRSNGSPKKLSKLIEENFIIGLNHEGLGDNITTAKFYSGKLNIIISSQSKKSTENTFLNLSFKQQYKFSFNAYLFFPFLSVQNNFMGNYSDSILVSTPYLMDNIIKFHPFAFSIHNLELFPEILSTNKSPEIRFFIEELVRYLSNNHIRETEAGLFQYKFFDKIHNEISYISKISDEESAAFNFSLDESYSIKSHIAAKIKFVRTTFKEFKKKDSASIESLIFLNDVLGDSQIFDEYYDDAVISLSDALHDVPAPEFVLDINDNFIRSTSTEVFLLWMRIRLKLAMVFEKMKYQEMAMGHLGVAMDTATKYLKNLLTYSKAKKLSIPLYRELLQVTQQAILGSIYVQEKFAEGITFAKLESYLILYSEIHEHAYYKDYNGRDMLMANFYAQIGTILYYKNKTLPFRSTQKMIFNENGKAGEAEKDFLAIAISQIQETPVFRLGKNNQESNILDGASKEIPFYDFVSASYKEIYKFFNFNKDKRGQDFRFSFATFVTYKKSLATYLAIENIKGNQYTLQIIISDCIKILTEFRNVHNPRKLIAIGNLITKISDLLFSLYKAPLDDKTKKIDLNTINQIIIDYQNVNINGNKNIDLDDIIFKKTSKGYELFNWNPDHLSICYIALLYYLSGRFYLKAGRTVTFAFQLKKILLIFHTSNALNGDYTEIKKITDFFGKTILRNILETVSWTSNNSDRPQISTSKHYLGINDAAIQGDLTQTFYQHLSNNPDSKEAILLFLSLKMKLYPYSINWETIESFEKATNQITELKFISQTNSISHQSVRIMEHSLQLKINKLLLARVISNKLKFKLKFNKEEVDILLFNPETDTKISWEKNLFLYVLEYDTQTNTILENKSATFRKNTDFPNDPITPFFDEILKIKNDENKLIYFKHYTELITNSIFCLHQCIISSNLYGINYMQGYTYIASFHKKMGDWLKHYSLCKLLLIYIEKKEHEENKELRTILTVMQNDIYMLLGNVAMRNLEDPLSHYQTALQYYIKAIQMHSEGSPYKDQINNMIYMEDDYNDNLSHFGAAIERQIINSGKLRDTITQLSEELRYSKLYDYNNFI